MHPVAPHPEEGQHYASNVDLVTRAAHDTVLAQRLVPCRPRPRALVVGATRWALRNSTCPAFEEDANFNKKAGLVASGRAICRDGELVPSISAPAEISQLWALEAKFCTFNKELHQPKCTFRKARRLPSGW